MKTALILGITGQDGSYLADFLLERGYEVCGLVRQTGSSNFHRISHIEQRLTLIHGDITKQDSLDDAIKSIQPDEVYNFASQSFIPLSWNEPILTTEVNGIGVVRILEAIRKHSPDTRFYQASSSEMFGDATESPQSETTPFRPRNPYGASKVLAHHLTANYRDNYGIFACAGICFNHESPRRGQEFVTRKLTFGVAQIKLGLTRNLPVGNLEAKRDWGFAPDYVRAMWLMLQQPDPDDFVIATGQARTVKELVDTAFSSVGLKWQDHVVVDEKLFRPAEKVPLVGNASKAKKMLNWESQVSFESMIELMVKADVDCLANGH